MPQNSTRILRNTNHLHVQAIRFQFNTRFWKALWVFSLKNFFSKASWLQWQTSLLCSGSLQWSLNVSDLSKSTLLLIFPTGVKCWEPPPSHSAVQWGDKDGPWAESNLHQHQKKMLFLSTAIGQMQVVKNQLYFMRFFFFCNSLFVLFAWIQIISNLTTLLS